jgi:hypothetical protein
LWAADPSTYDSFIHNTSPVYPGARRRHHEKDQTQRVIDEALERLAAALANGQSEAMKKYLSATTRFSAYSIGLDVEVLPPVAGMTSVLTKRSAHGFGYSTVPAGDQRRRCRWITAAAFSDRAARTQFYTIPGDLQRQIGFGAVAHRPPNV